MQSVEYPAVEHADVRVVNVEEVNLPVANHLVYCGHEEREVGVGALHGQLLVLVHHARAHVAQLGHRAPPRALPSGRPHQERHEEYRGDQGAGASAAAAAAGTHLPDLPEERRKK